MDPAPTYPVFLVLPQVGDRIATLLPSLEPVRSTIGSDVLRAVDVYYRTATDTALLSLRFDPPHVTRDLLAQISASAAQIGAAVVEPLRLPEAGRRRFFDAYLPLYDVCFGGLRGPELALRVLLRHLQGATPVPSKTHPGERLEVRFRRGDEWQLARLRSVTREGISVATATPPHHGDLVEVELQTGTLSLIAKTSVVGVAVGEAAAALGATGFGARFVLAHEAERRRLEEILALVGGDHAPPLDPPPYRREARYPVRWPVTLRTPENKVSVRALDMSRRGMFVAGAAPTEGAVHVTFTIDDRGTPILATARVARAIHDDTARIRRLPVGMGLELMSLSSQDERRFHQFVGRIARRADRAVVVGASPERLGELTSALSAAGYSAAGASDASSLVARAATTSRPPDLVVLDSSMSARALQAARRALGARRIPTLAIDGDSPTAAREHVDFALLS
ncbi:MAG TPA: PilZ domain-containing protein [Haliangiales bacterium]|nr:PilZ domain-containing protein [Haliangiales bacterium]